MKVSVLIATCNRPEHLRKCLQSLQNNSRPPDEILVIDQSDNSLSEEITRNIESSATAVHYERLDRRGKSLALNRAFELCTGDFLAFTDDDVMVDKKWIETFLQLKTEHPEIDVFCGRMLPEEEGGDNADYLNLVLDTETKWIDGKTDPIHPGFVGANCFISRQALLAVGKFNELFGPGAIFPSNEDGELAYRFVKKEIPILYAPQLVVYHSSWRSTKDISRLKQNYAYGLGAFAGHYLRRADLVPGRHILKIIFQKCRRTLIGVLLFDKERIQDGYIHVKGIGAGFFRGFFTPPPRGFGAP